MTEENLHHFFTQHPLCIYACVHVLRVCVCERSPHYLNLLLPRHRCQAIHRSSRGHINTTIKIANVPSTNKRKSLLLLLVQYTDNTEEFQSHLRQHSKQVLQKFETWQWQQTFLFSQTSTPALGLNQPPIQYIPGTLTPGSEVAKV
jgi:hypothetical protein